MHFCRAIVQSTNDLRALLLISITGPLSKTRASRLRTAVLSSATSSATVQDLKKVLNLDAPVEIFYISTVVNESIVTKGKHCKSKFDPHKH